MIRAELQRRAGRRLRQIERDRRDRRFVRTVGKLVAGGLLESTFDGVEPYTGRVSLGDALWAGQVEPRVLELLPAIVLKRPQFLALPKSLPEDLQRTVVAIRQGRSHPTFRGVEPRCYLAWVGRVGTRGRLPTTLKTFRLRPEDLARLHALKSALPARSETEVLRVALAALARREGVALGPGSD